MAGSPTQGSGLQEYSPSLSHLASNPRLFQKGHRPPVPLTEQAACSHSQAVEQLLNSEGTGVCWGVWTSEPHCNLDVKVEIQIKTKAVSGPSVSLDDLGTAHFCVSHVGA